MRSTTRTLKKVNPTTPARRKMTFADFSSLTRAKPEKSLSKIIQRSSGRDDQGHISVRHQGGGEKRKYRVISSTDIKLGVPAKVEHIEYDPNRSAFIGLVTFEDGVKAYILAWEGIKVGQQVIADEKTEIQPGNRLRLINIPNGIPIHDIEIQPTQGGKLVRSAGSQATIVAKEG